jgi:hypothetical protein
MATFHKETATLVDEFDVDDVFSIRSDLSHEQACEVLAVIADNYDANIGINWFVIDSTANYLFPEKAAEDKEYEVGNFVSVE